MAANVFFFRTIFYNWFIIFSFSVKIQIIGVVIVLLEIIYSEFTLDVFLLSKLVYIRLEGVVHRSAPVRLLVVDCSIRHRTAEASVCTSILLLIFLGNHAIF